MSSQSPSAGVARRADAVDRQFAAIVRDFLAELGNAGAVRRLTPDASLERHLGLGSLERVELISRLETEFGVKLPDSAIADAETVGDVLRAILAAEGRTPPEHIAVAVAASLTPAQTPQSAANLIEALYAHVEDDAKRPHVYVRDDDGSEAPISYGTLAARAVQVAAELQQRGIGPGDRVALMLPTSPDFFYCFMGVLLAQAIPAPIYPPVRADRLEEFAERQSAILRDAEAQLLVTFGRAETVGRLLRSGVPSLAEVVSAERWFSSPPPAHALPPIPSGGDLPALIQYTSGSTGNPKGVLLTHANLLANIRGIGRALDVQPDDSGVTWLPLYHDMGLIGCWLLSLYYGIPLTVLSPLSFLSRPERWLWAIHSHRATLSVGPNFAYDLCARRIRDEAIEGLDLSSWRAALNGSESVRPETVSRFTARFSRCGFRAEAMLPVYGLAESTVALCVPPLNRTPRLDAVRREPFETARRAEAAAPGERSLAFVSVGPPIADHEVRVVDAEGCVLGERIEGCIQFRGPSSMAGYFRHPEATAAITQDGWLDSGDLGYLADGELFITGRSKDVILKAGRNLYPQEIESAVAEIGGIRKGCVAAFGVVDAAQGTEKLVVAAETREQEAPARDRLRAQVTQQVLDALGVPADEVVLLAPGSLPKTSSGKLRRSAARQLYEEGRLAAKRPPALLQQLRLAARYVAEGAARTVGLVGQVVYSLYFWSLFVLFLLTCWLLLLVTPTGRRSAALIRAFTRLFLRLVGIAVRSDGCEHLQDGPSMLVSNHASYLDALALMAALPSGFLFVAKKEMQGWPVFATFLRKAQHLIVDRYSTAEGVSDTARLTEALGRGHSVLAFPEGTFTRARGLRPFKLGAFKAAAESGAPVVPVAVRGSRSVLPDKTWLLRRGPMSVSIRPAIHPRGRTWRDILGLRDGAFHEILACCGEPKVDLVSAAVPGR